MSHADGVEIDEPPAPSYERSSSDVVQVLGAVAALLVAIGVARVFGDGVRGIERDILRIASSAPPNVSALIVSLIQVGAIYLPVLVLGSMLILRRFRRMGVVLFATMATSLLMRFVLPLVEDSAAARVAFTRQGLQAVRNGATFPTTALVAVAAAIVTVETPWLGTAWRRALTVGLFLLGYARLASGGDLPVDLVVAYVAGWFVGCVSLLVWGRPNRRPRGVDVVDAMRRSGLPMRSVCALPVGSRASGAYTGVTAQGRHVFVKMLRGDDRAAHSAWRLYRYVRLRQVGDEHPFWSPRRRAEHEALVSLKAHSDGLPVPPILAVASAGPNENGMMLASELVVGRLLSDLDPDELTAPIVHSVWTIAAGLHSNRVAHRNLRLASMILDRDGSVWLVGFDSAELAADPGLLSNDLAELLCSTAARVGPERAVAAAAATVGAAALAAALPRLQPLALSSRTRADIASRPDMVDRVGREVRRVAGVDEVPLAQLERVKPRTVFVIAMSTFAVYLLLPQLANASDIPDLLRQADWAWVGAALVASAITYVGAAISISGSTPDRLPLMLTSATQVASSFANFATPAQVGGMAVNARFMQKQGTDPPVAVAAVGLNAVTGVVVHLALLGAFVVWAGNEQVVQFDVPARTVAIVVGILVVALAAGFVVPAARRYLLANIVPIIGRSVAGIAEIARRPAKIAALVGGALGVTAAYIAALVCSVNALGASAPVAAIGVVFLAGSVVAAAAPTPGGLGAVEAALIAGLTGIGLDGSTAFSAVLIFRFATFWFPLLPGWFLFAALEHRGAL